MKRTLNVILGVVCALGWAWTGWLKDNSYIGESSRLRVLIALTLVLLIQQWILTGRKPVGRSKVEQRRDVIELKLGGLLTDYYKQIKGAATIPPIRANLSLPKRTWRYAWRLQIYYFRTPDGSAFSNDELRMKFKKGEGAIGRAWSEKNIIIYDKNNVRFQSPINTVHRKKIPFVSQIESVLAVPILETDKVVGVLALDSEFPITATRFDQREIAALARSHANHLAGLCFFDGVK